MTPMMVGGIKHTKQTKMEENRKAGIEMRLKSVCLTSMKENVRASLYAEPSEFTTWATVCC